MVCDNIFALYKKLIIKTNLEMKKIIYLLVLVLGVTFTSCKKETSDPDPTCTDGIQNGDETGVDCGGSCNVCDFDFTVTEDDLDGDGVADQYVVTGKSNQNFTFTNDKIWVLSGKVVVEDRGILTIEPGTIIKGAQGTGSLASALVVARGGKINAVGTATSPIVMTSVNDDIALGQTAGTNLGTADTGLWGGLIVLGKAPASFEGDVTEFQIEGIPASESFGLYGGSEPTDNSGTMQYISIRHGGALIGADNEINGMTLGAVGSGTTIDHIEIVANQDDGVEFFGGTVHVSEILIWAQEDDGLDIDQAYSGTISNSVVIEGDNSDHALEIDGGEGSATGSFTLNNITLVGNQVTSKGEYADYRDAATGASNNIYAYGFKEDDSDVELDNNAVAQEYIDGNLTFSGWEIVLPGADTISDIFKEKHGSGESDISTFEADATTFATGVTAGSQTVGATASDFDWTYAHAQGAF